MAEFIVRVEEGKLLEVVHEVGPDLSPYEAIRAEVQKLHSHVESYCSDILKVKENLELLEKSLTASVNEAKGIIESGKQSLIDQGDQEQQELTEHKQSLSKELKDELTAAKTSLDTYVQQTSKPSLNEHVTQLKASLTSLYQQLSTDVSEGSKSLLALYNQYNAALSKLSTDEQTTLKALLEELKTSLINLSTELQGSLTELSTEKEASFNTLYEQLVTSIEEGSVSITAIYNSFVAELEKLAAAHVENMEALNAEGLAAAEAAKAAAYLTVDGITFSVVREIIDGQYVETYEEVV